ncbi:MAG: hypothetical protein HKP61_01005 [Dactylosporangium sp.]|nr:hypothetical protein [Dactylosporangium sp.]NNJ59549.1 hypothetical protein [Dactylosporangium sp.]
MAAASTAGYATRPVQLFYALSQAGRAIVAASPRIDNQSWRASGHGLSASTGVTAVADVTVSAQSHGLFPAVARALGAEPLVPGEPVALRDLWPLLPNAVLVPLTSDALLPVLLFQSATGLAGRPSVGATLVWIPHRVRDLHGDDHAQLKQHFSHYPSLSGLGFPVPPGNGVAWSEGMGPGLGLHVVFGDAATPTDTRSLAERKATLYRSENYWVVTPAIGSMTTALHPVLAWWGVLLALSSLARYEPAVWDKMIDIDASRDAIAIEHILDEAMSAMPAVVRQVLHGFQGQI